MNCEYFKELISARLDGELSTEEESVLSGHLSECVECSSLYEELLDQRESLGTRKPAEIPADVERKILDKTIQSSKRTSRAIGFLSGSYIVPKPLAWGVAAAIIILLFAAIFKPIDSIMDSKFEKTAGTGTVGVQKIVMTENDIKETRTFTKRNNL